MSLTQLFPLLKLPVEMLVTVVNQLDHFDQVQARLVCRTCKQVIDQLQKWLDYFGLPPREDQVHFYTYLNIKQNLQARDFPHILVCHLEPKPQVVRLIPSKDSSFFIRIFNPASDACGRIGDFRYDEQTVDNLLETWTSAQTKTIKKNHPLDEVANFDALIFEKNTPLYVLETSDSLRILDESGEAITTTYKHFDLPRNAYSRVRGKLYAPFEWNGSRGIVLVQQEDAGLPRSVRFFVQSKSEWQLKQEIPIQDDDTWDVSMLSIQQGQCWWVIKVANCKNELDVRKRAELQFLLIEPSSFLTQEKLAFQTYQRPAPPAANDVRFMGRWSNDKEIPGTITRCEGLSLAGNPYLAVWGTHCFYDNSPNVLVLHPVPQEGTLTTNLPVWQIGLVTAPRYLQVTPTKNGFLLALQGIDSKPSEEVRKLWKLDRDGTASEVDILPPHDHSSSPSEQSDLLALGMVTRNGALECYSWDRLQGKIWKTELLTSRDLGHGSDRVKLEYWNPRIAQLGKMLTLQVSMNIFGQTPKDVLK